MKQTLRILLLHHFPIVIDSFRRIIREEDWGPASPQIDVGYTSEDGYQKIIRAATENHPYDLVILEDGLPEYLPQQIRTGEDLCQVVRRKLPGGRILYLTKKSHTMLVNNIVCTIQPEGFLHKSEVTAARVSRAITTVISGGTFYSDRIVTAMRKKLTTDRLIDDYDRSILYHLSTGTKTKDLPKFVALSLPSIEKRKRSLKNMLQVGNDDRVLLEEARKIGFI